jgi:hypothetical protein
MMENDIICLNIEKFERMLETETNKQSRRTIEGMIREFEDMLSSSRLGDAPESGISNAEPIEGTACESVHATDSCQREASGRIGRTAHLR